MIKSDVLKMSHPKLIPSNFNELIQFVDPKMNIITGVRTKKNSPTPIELGEIIDSELFLTDSVGAVWLYSDGKNQFEVKVWK